MKKTAYIFFGLILIGLGLHLFPRDHGIPLVLSDAKSFWNDIYGGTGGQHISVTTLAARGPGSLNECIETKGPRICEFSISGTIELKENLFIKEPFITISGDRAPSPGITIVGAGIQIQTHDVIIEHLRIRPGDALDGPEPDDRDGISIKGNASDSVYNILIDHVSVSWATDENIDIWQAGARNIVISNSIISEGLSDSIHSKGEHSKGMLVGGDGIPPENIFIIGNLFAHNAERNPLVTHGTVLNNLIYNWNYHGTHVRGGDIALEPSHVNIIGNVYIPGPSTLQNPRHPIALEASTKAGSKVYIHDNMYLKGDLEIRDWNMTGTALSFSVKSEKPYSLSKNIPTITANETLIFVYINAGARPYDRDTVDTRIITEVGEKTGSLVDCVFTCKPGTIKAKTN